MVLFKMSNVLSNQQRCCYTDTQVIIALNTLWNEADMSENINDTPKYNYNTL